MITKKIIQAIDFAIDKHRNQTRKGKTVPYIVHPLDVMNILLKEEGLPEELIIAGVCHDLVEDTDTSLDEIKELFGEEVAKLVDSDSEPEELKKNPNEKETWKERKQDTIDRVSKGNEFEKMLACADKLANLTDIKADLDVGVDIFGMMNAPKEQQKWYYESMLESFRTGESIEENRMYKLLGEKIIEVFE